MSQLGVSHSLLDAQGLLAVQGVTTEGDTEQWPGRKEAVLCREAQAIGVIRQRDPICMAGFECTSVERVCHLVSALDWVEIDALLCPSPLVALIFSREMSNINNTHRKV